MVISIVYNVEYLLFEKKGRKSEIIKLFLYGKFGFFVSYIMCFRCIVNRNNKRCRRKNMKF